VSRCDIEIPPAAAHLVVNVDRTARRQRIEELFHRYGQGVGSYVYARVGDAELAEQITSSVFLIVVERLEQCRGSTAGWIYSIVRSELARYFRDRRPAETISATLLDPTPSPAQVAERRELQRRMKETLNRLSDEQQRIVYMKYFQDTPNVEIAATLGMRAGNVGVIIHRAVKRLRELMETSPAKTAVPGER
jgi:RNA polymerase sigma-70 factor (ECF subfamily)